MLREVYVHRVSQQHYSKQLKGNSSPYVHQQMDLKNCDLVQTLAQSSKEGDPDTGYSVNKPCKRYGQWNKPDTKDKYSMISLKGGPQSSQTHRHRKEMRGYWGLGEGRGVSVQQEQSLSRRWWKPVCRLRWWAHGTTNARDAPESAPAAAVRLLSRVWLLLTPCAAAPGFPVLHCLPEFAQTHGHWVGDAIHLIFCCPSYRWLKW